MDSKTRGWVFIVGALVAAYLAWPSRDWADLVLALLFLVSGAHHVSGKHRK